VVGKSGGERLLLFQKVYSTSCIVDATVAVIIDVTRPTAVVESGRGGHLNFVTAPQLPGPRQTVPGVSPDGLGGAAGAGAQETLSAPSQRPVSVSGTFERASPTRYDQALEPQVCA
jgi:hypothetical protein